MAVSTIDALYNGTSEKLTTSATGITVTGTVAATAYTGDGSALTGTGSPSIDDNGNATAITITSDENVGIGVTPSSAYKMQVAVATNTPSTGSPAASSLAAISGGTATVGDGVSLQLNNTSGAKETAWRMSAVTTSGNNGDLVFNGYTGGATYPERMRILSGGGITFNGDTAAANALDDYEEGTFTPIFGSGFSGINYAQQHGFYTKVGNTVTIYYSLQLNSSTNTTAAQVVIGNLPFATSTSGAVYQVASSYISTSNVGSANNTLFITSPNSTSIAMYLQNSNGVQARTGSSVGSSFYTSGTLTYFTPA